MGVRRNFSRGEGNVEISLVLIQVASDAMRMDRRKTFSTLSTPQRKFPMKSRAPFEIVFRWSCIRVSEKVLFVFLYSFAELGYHPISLLL